jgi:hypothetical protein
MHRTSITFVIPTLGERPDLLAKSVAAASRVADALVILVGPRKVEPSLSKLYARNVKFIDDEGATGAAEAINIALRFLPSDSEFFTWIGDDDEVIPGQIEFSIARLRSEPSMVATYGNVEYVDSSGRQIRMHRPPRKPKFSLNFGPQRIAQPGMVFRTSLISSIGSLRPTLKCAWDQDFITRAFDQGPLLYVDRLVAKYAWHEGALTSEHLGLSMVESAEIRIARQVKALRPFLTVFEYARIVASLLIGTSLTRRKPTSFVAKAVILSKSVRSRLKSGPL